MRQYPESPVFWQVFLTGFNSDVVIPQQHCKRTIASESVRHQCYLSALVSVGHLILCLFPSWLCCPTIGGGLFLHLAILNFAVWQGSRAELLCRWVSLGWCGWEKGLQHERCSTVGKEENLTFCWHLLVFNSPDMRKNFLNRYQYSSRIGLDQLCRMVLGRGAGVTFFCWLFIFTAKRKNIQKQKMQNI